MIYLSGPITLPNPMHNTHVAVKIASRLIRLGLTPFVPHLSVLWDTINPESYDNWIKYDLRILDKCDLLVRIPGESKGADIEWDYAQSIKLPTLKLPTTDDIECSEYILKHLAGVDPL